MIIFSALWQGNVFLLSLGNPVLFDTPPLGKAASARKEMVLMKSPIFLARSLVWSVSKESSLYATNVITSTKKTAPYYIDFRRRTERTTSVLIKFTSHTWHASCNITWRKIDLENRRPNKSRVFFSALTDFLMASQFWRQLFVYYELSSELSVRRCLHLPPRPPWSRPTTAGSAATKNGIRVGKVKYG